MKLRPTKHLIWFLLLLVLSLAPAALVNSPIGYLPVCTLFFSALLSLLHLLLVKNRLRCSARPGKPVLTRGEEVPFVAAVENASILPVPLISVRFFLAGHSGQDEHTYPLTLSLSPKEKREFSLSADFSHIGVYEAGLRQLVVTGLFGIFRAVSREETRQQLEIQPRLLDVERLPMDQRQTAEHDRARVSAPLAGMDYVGVREYAYGDPIKTIQWKLSAHASTLMTKQMESYTNTGAMVVLDFRIPLYDRETRLELADGVAESGAAAGYWAARSGLECLLLLTGEDGQAHSCAPASFRDLRPWLPYMCLREPDEHGALAQDLRNECGGVHSQNNILLCTADLTEETAAALQTLKQNRKNPVLLLLMPEGIDEKRRKTLLARMARLQHAGIPCRTGKNAREVLA